MASSQEQETKSIITGLLTSSTRRCTIKQLCQDFRDIVGYEIPFRHVGFSTAEDYFRSIPDTLTIYGSGPFAEVSGVFKPNSAHMKELVAKQKRSTPKSRRSCRPFVSNHRRRPIPRYRSPTPGYHLNHSNRTPLQNNDPSPKLEFFFNNEAPLPNASTSNVMNWLGLSNNDSRQSIEYARVSPSLPNIQIQNHVVSTNPYGIKRENLVNSAASSCNETSILTVDNHNHIVSQKTQDNLKKLILKFPDGIWCTQLPIEYRKMFNKKLSYEKYSYRSLIEMCVDMPDIFHYTQPTSDDFLLYDKNKPVPKVYQNVESTDYPSGENIVTTSILNEIPKLNWQTAGVIPPGVLHLGEVIPKYVFGDSLKMGDYIEINVGEIYDISKFYIYMVFGGLNSLMNELQSFYNIYRNKYLIVEQLLCEGLYCSCLYLGEYHRALIVNMMPNLEGYVRVLFVDYGTVENVPSNEIWYLPKQFSTLPCQAIRTRLSVLKPPVRNSPWSLKTVNRFKTLVIDRTLIAEVIQVDQEENLIGVYLADITDDKSIFFVNDLLVDEGLAVYEHEEMKPEMFVDPNCTPTVEFIHLFPTFDEIEAGIVPSTSDMNYIIMNKIPLHHLFPQWFKTNSPQDVDHIVESHEKFSKSIKNYKIQVEKIKRDFDISYFPETIADEIYEIFNQDETNYSRTSNKVPSTVKPCDIVVNEEKESVREYFCNKKRLADLKSGIIDQSRSISDICYSESSQDDIVPLNNSLQKLSLTSESVISNHSKSFKSTNPFLSCDSPDLNPFSLTPSSSTNPFLNDYDIIEPITSSDLFERISKSSVEELPEKIVNNLNPSTSRPCSCKLNKRVNVDRPVEHFIEGNQTTLEVKKTTEYGVNLTENCEVKKEEGTARVRSPPGFNSVIPQNVQYYNYVPNNGPNNLYYQHYPQYQYPNSMYFQNQYNYNARPMPNYYNYVPPFHPAQFQFNLQFLQQSLGSQHFNQQTPPRTPSRSNPTQTNYTQMYRK